VADLPIHRDDDVDGSPDLTARLAIDPCRASARILAYAFSSDT
jgi:hypothetical protein